jgi:hypothetical protein
MGLMITRICAALLVLTVVCPSLAEAQCTYSVSPLSQSVPLTGMSGSVSVITGSSCAWTATSPDSWITVAGGSHAGLGSVAYTVAASSTARTGTITVAGQTVTINQGAGGCSFTVSPLSQSVPSTPFSGSISVITGSSCSWTATSAQSWITVAGGSHAGLGSVTYSVAANSTSSARTGTISVAGQTVTITQAVGSCTYSVSPLSQSVPSTPFSGAVSVITGSSCAWTATSPQSWITVASGSHSGLGSVAYSVAANSTTSARTGTITVAGQAVTITQAAGSCAYSVSPLSQAVPSTPFSGAISVSTGSACAWTATSPQSWITVASGSHSGLGSVAYTVAANSTSSTRTGTISVAGQTVTITQAAGAAVNPQPPTGVRIIR